MALTSTNANHSTIPRNDDFRFPPFSRRENGRISAHKQAKEKSGVPKEAQDDGLSNGISGGRQILPRRPTGQQRDISLFVWDISL